MFSVLDISSNSDNNEFNTCISTDTFPTSENQSMGQLSSVSDFKIFTLPCSFRLIRSALAKNSCFPFRKAPALHTHLIIDNALSTVFWILHIAVLHKSILYAYFEFCQFWSLHIKDHV